MALVRFAIDLLGRRFFISPTFSYSNRNNSLVSYLDKRTKSTIINYLVTLEMEPRASVNRTHALAEQNGDHGTDSASSLASFTYFYF